MKYVILYKSRSVVKLPISETYDVTTHSSKPHTVVFVTLKGEFEAATSPRQIEGESAGKLKRCHREYLVSESKISGFDYATRIIKFTDSRISYRRSLLSTELQVLSRLI
ncbi:TPA: LytTR family transcriptional regulator DNA-binding domain-containing protein [Streptococcus equi subsp. zooepidemicus]|uniref:LytTR family transcriptional regulator DNA-binding domain-containing protein n=1 Tax=Streptococcus equi TaxID=1336 RepID=UPI0013F5E02D|nr:LytTR family transcriptional regulator DNA-binding domain-containing protein [Streptococcus equi]MCD3395941.1 LytTR family transcriptional regulator DNA-binding domain-containing protein [Streptococcus equi subsp. zooepidemicus]MCD3402934.1 LytTR family transcriptional regulator DNA-binding domain-containing protein [Streptococcus equi subsp. zooepidemicus]MCD3449664.1 LytTR family transcriptional regulator DNA-binding domain-containing protein [Streptococcus equi subsp. zooepidemicus]MCD345